MKLIYFVGGVLGLYFVTTLPGFDSGFVKLLGLTLLSLILAASLRPSLAGIWQQRRAPTRRELLVIFTCFLTCAVSIWALDIGKFLAKDASWAISKPGGASHYDVIDLSKRIGLFLVVIIALVPAVRLVLAGTSIDERARPVMWPALLSIFAALPVLLGGNLLLVTADRQALRPAALFLNVVLAFPPTLILVAFGLLLWWRAWQAASDAGFSLAGIFPRLVTAAMMIWLVAMVAASAGLLVFPGPHDMGQIIGVAVFACFGAAWLWLLRSVADLEASGLVAVSVAAVGLGICFGVTTLVARGLVESSHTQIGDASVLVLLFALPVIGILIAAIVLVVPRLLALLLTRSEPPVSPAAAR